MEHDNQFKFETTIYVRFGDMDAMGHVNNAKYLTYFEQARVEYFRLLFGRGVESSMDQSFIIAEIRIRFLASAKEGDQLKVMARVSRFGSKSFDFEYHIVNKVTGVLVCDGSSVQVMYDYISQSTIPLPKEFIQRVQDFEGYSIKTS